MPLAMRLQVESASGRARSKMDGAGMFQSMQSAAVRQGFMPGGTLPFASGWAWVMLRSFSRCGVLRVPRRAMRSAWRRCSRFIA